MHLETLSTLNASRDGLLVARGEPCPLHSRLWVSFPLDPAGDGFARPELRARVVRIEQDPATPTVAIALQIERVPAAAPAPSSERRSSPRVGLALPILVRPAGAPWPRECMTDDVSRGGVRFETPQVFTPGDRLRAAIPWGEWTRRGEVLGRVMRVEPRSAEAATGPSQGPFGGPAGVLASVAIRWDRNADA